ncbi:hypothetical protein [Sphingomonas sp. IW22]|uniref:hypothetical protein n=1 Tax=Sphingomonas sp. IW22 TaxID=3242489 RepID=UPI00351F9815
MNKNLHFYMDDSGARHLDYVPKEPGQQDWFALGGILIAEEDEEVFRAAHLDFMQRWRIQAPLHSFKIRGCSKEFSWISQLSEVDRVRFYNELTQLVVGAPVTGTACVIDRPGYDLRY